MIFLLNLSFETHLNTELRHFAYLFEGCIEVKVLIPWKRGSKIKNQIFIKPAVLRRSV